MKLTVIKWRDIPTQVMIKKSRKEVAKILLDKRFMEAVDSAAMRSGDADTDAYLTDWCNEVIEVKDAEITTAVQEFAQQLEIEISPELLNQYIANKGYKPT